MEKELLDYFDNIEEYFKKFISLDRQVIEEIVVRAKKDRINLGPYNSSNPLSLFDCLCSDLGSCSIFDKDDNLLKEIDYKESLYELLNEYGYYYNNDIKLALKKFQRSPSKDKYLAYELSYNGREGYRNVRNFELDRPYIYITDESDYTYTIIDLSNYDMEKDEFNLSRISSVIAKGGFNDCHNYAEQIAHLLPEGETITAACPRFTQGNYYLHSYTQYGDYIIDLTMNMMMPKKDYYSLMSPIELSRTKNVDVLDKKTEIESKIGNLDDLGKYGWAYILYIGFLNIKDNPEILNGFSQDGNLPKKK